jgi:hypothetical protein
MIEMGRSPFKVKTKMTKTKNTPLFKLTYKKFFLMKNINDYSTRAKKWTKENKFLVITEKKERISSKL